MSCQFLGFHVGFPRVSSFVKICQGKCPVEPVLSTIGERFAQPDRSDGHNPQRLRLEVQKVECHSFIRL
jgi:flagellar motor switch protein FliM